MPIRVLVLAQTFDPAHGGGARWTTELAHGLAERGNEVLVVTHDIAGITGTRKPRPGLEIRYIPMFKVRGAPFFSPRMLQRTVAQFKPGVIQTSAPSLSDVLLPPSVRLGVPYVTMFHAQYGASRAAKLLQNLNLRRLRHGEWARVSVSSDYWRRWLVERGIEQQIVHIIPPVVTRAFSGPLPGVRREDGHLLFVGGLDSVQSYKRFDLLIDACALLERQGTSAAWRVSVVGDGNLRAQFEKRVQELSLGDRIRFLGGVDDAELHALYSGAAATVLPSSDPREGWGIVLAEASCCGCRIVLSDGMGGTGTFGKAPGAVVVKAGDALSLRDGLLAIITGEADGRDAERIAFGSQFQAAPVLAQYEELYRGAADVRQSS